MIRGIEFYIVVWIIFMVAAISYRHMTGKEKWAAAKIIWFGAWTAAIAMSFVVGVVMLF